MIGLASEDLDALFTRLGEKRFAVLGDFCLDAYYFLDQAGSEISVETGLRTNAVRSMRFTPGGAGNVAANLTALGARHVYALGVVGDDIFGREYRSILASRGVNTDHMAVQKNEWHTGVYTKRYDAGTEKPRIDIGNFNRLDPSSIDLLLDGLRKLLPDLDVVLINQQLLNGIHTPEFREMLKPIIRAAARKTFLLDSRDFNDEYQGALRKVNDREAALAAGLDPHEGEYTHVENVRRAAWRLYERWGAPVFITRGDRGSVVFDGQNLHEIPGLHILGGTDTVGAGDSVFAGLAAGLAAGFDHGRSLLFATYVAGVTIQKRFVTGTANPDEVRALAGSAEFNLNPEKADALRTAVYWPDSEIEIVRDSEKRDFEYALFDHDGTISTLREGWEAVMEPVMVKAVLGEALDRIDEETHRRVVADARKLIDDTTGVQTLVQMRELTKLVQRWGFVPREGMLDPWGYKRLYLKTLNRMVESRINKVARGEMNVDDFTMKGAVAFLKTLREKGMTLYLASGTDEADVRREAEFLGYADFFNGGIFGAGDAIAVEPKRVVLDRILDRIGRSNGSRIVTFGDGPVEMRETWKVGGCCVGIAGDEIRRFGLNVRKRKRLILAGAHVIVPDFSQSGRLAEVLFL